MQVVHETWHSERVKHQVASLRKHGFNVLDLQEGFCSQLDGMMVFRATHMGNDRYDVAYAGEIMMDV